MKVFSPLLNGTTTTTGSFTVPNHPTSESISNPLTGSLYNDTTDNILKIYNGTSWVTVGEQAIAPPGPASADIEYLLVAGGGAGGGGTAGGGGAGGYLSSSLSSVESGSAFTITLGSGGASTGTVTQGVVGNDGVDSTIVGDTISTITAIAGGGGGDRDTGTTGRAGGSGGGGGGSETVSLNVGGSGTTGQGNDGGSGRIGGSNSAGGGGGGAGAVGADSPSNGLGGNGGAGLASSITGTSTTRAGGGGGGSHSGQSSGGTGGGGAGATSGNLDSVAGATNTGGGGGGAGGSSPRLGNAGGSGVAILAYDSGSINGAGGIVGDAGNGRKYHQFNSSGTFKTGNTSDFAIHTSNLVMHVDAGQYASRTGATDLSGYDNDLNLGGQSGGSLTNNPWWNGDGTGGIADFERNGGSTASTVAHTGYGSMTGAATNAWTIEFWIRTTATGGNAILGKTIIGTNSSGVWATISIKGNKLNYSHADNGGSWVHTPATTDINDGTWHHCVLVNFTNETCNMFVDGVKEVSAGDSGMDSGRYMKMDSLGRGYNGENTAMDIGQIRVYDASLTDAQVTQNYNATKTNFV